MEINCIFGYGEQKKRLLTMAKAAPVYGGP